MTLLRKCLESLTTKESDGLIRTPFKDGSYIDINAYDLITNYLGALIDANIKVLDKLSQILFKGYVYNDAYLLTPILLTRLNIDTWEKVKHVIYDLEKSGIFKLSDDDRKNLEEYFTNTIIYDENL